MHKFMARFFTSVVFFFLAGCATYDDVRQATDLIRTDNELVRVLGEERAVNPINNSINLVSLGDHAKEKAEILKNVQGRELDAIAYYRIAATAYWRSNKVGAVNDLFNVTNNGTDLCHKLVDKSPDRDCLFLQLVIPFAGLEYMANKKGLSGLIHDLKFYDTVNTSDEITSIKKIPGLLNQAKDLIIKILSIGGDDRLLNHKDMEDYYCNNANKAMGYFDSTSGVFVTKVREFHENFPNEADSSGLSIEKARSIRKMDKGIPSFCQ